MPAEVSRFAGRAPDCAEACPRSWSSRSLFLLGGACCEPQTAAAPGGENEAGTVQDEGKDGDAVHDKGKGGGLIDIGSVPDPHAANVATDDDGAAAEAPGCKTADVEADADGPSEVGGACASTGSTTVASGCADGPSSATAPACQCEDWAPCGCFLSWQPGLAQIWAPLGQAWPGLAEVQPSGKLKAKQKRVPSRACFVRRPWDFMTSRAFTGREPRCALARGARPPPPPADGRLPGVSAFRFAA